MRIVDVDAAERVEIDRVRRHGPRAAEELGVIDLQPQTAPTAGGIPGEVSCPRLGNQAKLLFEVWNKLLDQGLAARPVDVRVGKHGMAPRRGGIEPDANERDLGPAENQGLGSRLVMITAEARNRVDRRKATIRLRVVLLGRNDDGAHHDVASVKLGQPRTAKLNQPGPRDGHGFVDCLYAPIDHELDHARRGRIEQPPDGLAV